MDMIQLEHFLAVAAERTFTRAAERVFRTQPAPSQSIKRLEEYVGTSLFAREMSGVSLTEAGKSFAVYAREILRMRDEATRTLSGLQTLEGGTLRSLRMKMSKSTFYPALCCSSSRCSPKSSWNCTAHRSRHTAQVAQSRGAYRLYEGSAWISGSSLC